MNDDRPWYEQLRIAEEEAEAGYSQTLPAVGAAAPDFTDWFRLPGVMIPN